MVVAAPERLPEAVALDTSVLAFFLFMFINGAVVFAAGSMRMVGATAVAAVLLARLMPARSA